MMEDRLYYQSIEKKARTRRIVKKTVIYFFLAVWALMVLFPFYWMILTSFKTYSAYNSEYIPKGLMMIVIIPAAFAFSRLDFKGRNLLFTFFLALMMIPNELVIITNFQTITNLGMRNTFAGLILPSVTSVFYIYLLKENFEQIPESLYKAAKVDGTSDIKYLLKVMVPICRPTIITIIILKVIECWNSYVWPRLITDDQAYFLVSNGIQEIRENGFGRENIPAMMAAVVSISVPLIIIFLVFRRKIMEGVSRGGTKG